MTSHTAVRRYIEDVAEALSAQRILVGEGGHWIQRHMGDDRWGVYGPDANLLAVVTGEDRAKAACVEHAATGAITR
jgi:hypothetical protein